MDEFLLSCDGKSDLMSPVILQIIPDLYLRYGKEEHIIIGPKTEKTLKTLSLDVFPLLRVDYWPHSFGKDHMGKALILDLKSSTLTAPEKGLFYRNKEIVFFQRLPMGQEDISLTREYLKRYGITLPTPTILSTSFGSIESKGKILRQLLQDELSDLKLKLFRTPPTIGRSPLLSSFHEHRRSFWKETVIRGGLGVLSVFVCFLSINLYWDRLHRLEEIETLRSKIVLLTPEERKLCQTFYMLQTYHQDAAPVQFEFAKKMMPRWKNHFVITSMQWKREKEKMVTDYTLTFNPESLGSMDKLTHWLETQHPHVTLTEKDPQHGTLHLTVPVL